jgi:hypothetical protein
MKRVNIIAFISLIFFIVIILASALFYTPPVTAEDIKQQEINRKNNAYDEAWIRIGSLEMVHVEVEKWNVEGDRIYIITTDGAIYSTSITNVTLHGHLGGGGASE